jgi:hypothetical protein
MNSLRRAGLMTLCGTLSACASVDTQGAADGADTRGWARGVNVVVENATDRPVALSIIELPGGRNRGGYSDLAAGDEGAVAFAVEDSVEAVRPVFSSRAGESVATHPCAQRRFTGRELRFGVRLTREASGALVCEMTGAD